MHNKLTHGLLQAKMKLAVAQTKTLELEQVRGSHWLLR